jgi:hypothetical protein
MSRVQQMFKNGSCHILSGNSRGLSGTIAAAPKKLPESGEIQRVRQNIFSQFSAALRMLIRLKNAFQSQPLAAPRS